jgi:hypothetical protein
MKKRLINNAIIPEELYILRDADRQLKSIIEDMGRPGYILVSRQMGKTNLLINAKRKYENNEDFFIYVDLSNPFPDARSCFENIVDTFIDVNFDRFTGLEDRIRTIRKNNTLPPHRQHLNELRLILNFIPGKLVVVLDEIDGLIKTDYSDVIFSQIRSIYFSRANFEELNRLTYILSGVIDPKNLIKDPTISPFNIGAKIFLNDFTFQEFTELVDKLDYQLSEDLINHIFSWTNGNPRLSWDVISEVENYILENDKIPLRDDIDKLISDLYFVNYNKPPIDHIRELVKADPEMKKVLVGLQYGKKDGVSDALKDKLYLAGIINYESSSSIGIKNKIIENALSEEWLLSIQNEVSYTTALDLINKDSFKEAILVLEKLIEGENDEYILNSLYYQIGLSHYKLRTYNTSLDYLNKISEEAERDSLKLFFSACFLKGSINLELGKFDNSISDFASILSRKLGDEIFTSSIILHGSAVLGQNRKAKLNSTISEFRELLNLIESKKIKVDNESTTIAYLNFILGHLYGRIFENTNEDVNESILYFEKALATTNNVIIPQIYHSLINAISDLDSKEEQLENLLMFLEDKMLLPSSFASEAPIDFSWPTLKEIIKIIVFQKSENKLERILKLYESITIESLLEINEDLILSSLFSPAEFLVNFTKRYFDKRLNENINFQIFSHEIALTTLQKEDLRMQAKYIKDLAQKEEFSLTKLDLLIIHHTINGFDRAGDYINAIELTKLNPIFSNRILRHQRPDYLLLLVQKMNLLYKYKMNIKDSVKEVISWLDNNNNFSAFSLLSLENINSIKSTISAYLNEGIKYDRNDILEYEFAGQKLNAKYKNIMNDLKENKIKITNIL